MDINVRLTALADEISKLEEKLDELQSEEWELKRSLNGYYIGCITEDDEDYHYKEVFNRLGFCSETDAKEWAEKQNAYIDGVHYTADYFEVTEQENSLYYLWENISDALGAISHAEFCMNSNAFLKGVKDCPEIGEKDMETLKEFADWLEELEDRVRETLGKTKSYQNIEGN